MVIDPDIQPHKKAKKGKKVAKVYKKTGNFDLFIVPAELTRQISVRSVGHMLAASGSVPNSQTPAAPPRPTIWHGVTEGMARAKEAIEAGELERAEQILLELIEFAPAETNAWKLLARTQREMGYYREGIASAKRALALQDRSNAHEPPASITLARLLWQQQEQKQARDMLATLMRRQPENSELAELHRQWSSGEVE